MIRCNMSRLAAEPNSVVHYHGQDAAITLADLASMQFEIITVEAAAASVLPPVTPHV